jgi:hypothetical protein
MRQRPGASAVVVQDHHLDGLPEEIIRKQSQFDAQAWAEGRLSRD